MEVFKTRLFFSDFDHGRDYLIDTIELDGAWWLVGSWLESNATGERVPERLVRLSGLAFEQVTHPHYRFVLERLLPKAALDGKALDGFVVANYPVLARSPAPSKSQKPS